MIGSDEGDNMPGVKSAGERLGPFWSPPGPSWETPVQGIGDLESDARGSAARFNAGKPQLDLVPLRLIALSFETERTPGTRDVFLALTSLGLFQETHYHGHLNNALSDMRDSWEDCARVFDYGRAKYAQWNWAKGMPWSAAMASAGRHAIAALRGETFDQESKLPHRGHLMCNLVMLRTFVQSYPEGNDLPSPDLFRAAGG